MRRTSRSSTTRWCSTSSPCCATRTARPSCFRRLVREIGDPALLRGHARPADRADRDRDPDGDARRRRCIAGKKLVFAPILRAGLGMAEGMLDLVPSARVAHIGLYRDPITLQAVEYYFKAPDDSPSAWSSSSIRCWPPANTAIAAVDRLKEARRRGHALRLPAGRAGGNRALPRHPSRRADLDRRHRQPLNDHGYIVPGLGDAGDRMFGTK